MENDVAKKKKKNDTTRIITRRERKKVTVNDAIAALNTGALTFG